MGLQFALLLPVGAVTDLLGARRTGVISCAVRAVGFVMLGSAGSVGALLGAAVALAVGGALYNPAGHSLLASVGPAARSGGFAAYVAAQHLATVAGPPMGLLLLGTGSGFALLTGTAAALWVVAGFLFLFVPRSGEKKAPARPRDVLAGVRAVLGDRVFLYFALLTAPTTLLATHIMTAVPSSASGPRWRRCASRCWPWSRRRSSRSSPSGAAASGRGCCGRGCCAPRRGSSSWRRWTERSRAR
ncbi:MFS transporter [Actinomadura luteofluorescens]|uniref:MFS transporter n=1 Tax=Actinomadura luteofluorescens TaxID=46163 RepID=UPI0036271A93